jgi:hypothetical protein
MRLVLCPHYRPTRHQPYRRHGLRAVKSAAYPFSTGNIKKAIIHNVLAELAASRQSGPHKRFAKGARGALGAIDRAPIDSYGVVNSY